MSLKAYVIRFPNGDFEVDVSNGVTPAVDQTVRRRGVLWKVTGTARDVVSTVHVERVARRRTDGPSHAM